MKKSLLFISMLMAPILSSYGYWGTGVSTYPMLMDNKFLSTEITGDFSANGGLGFQGRYTQKINQSTIVDAGVGFSGGDRTGRIFASIDYEIFPDYQKQPRISTKAFYENSAEDGQRKNIIGVIPTFSKGFNFWGQEAYPYASVPMGVSLDKNNKSYDTFLKLSLGISGKIPYESLKHLTASVEGTLNIKDSYSGLYMALHFPIN